MVGGWFSEKDMPEALEVLRKAGIDVSDVTKVGISKRQNMKYIRGGSLMTLTPQDGLVWTNALLNASLIMDGISSPKNLRKEKRNQVAAWGAEHINEIAEIWHSIAGDLPAEVSLNDKDTLCVTIKGTGKVLMSVSGSFILDDYSDDNTPAMIYSRILSKMLLPKVRAAIRESDRKAEAMKKVADYRKFCRGRMKEWLEQNYPDLAFSIKFPHMPSMSSSSVEKILSDYYRTVRLILFADDAGALCGAPKSRNAVLTEIYTDLIIPRTSKNSFAMSKTLLERSEWYVVPGNFLKGKIQNYSELYRKFYKKYQEENHAIINIGSESFPEPPYEHSFQFDKREISISTPIGSVNGNGTLSMNKLGEYMKQLSDSKSDMSRRRREASRILKHVEKTKILGSPVHVALVSGHGIIAGSSKLRMYTQESTVTFSPIFTEKPDDFGKNLEESMNQAKIELEKYSQFYYVDGARKMKVMIDNPAVETILKMVQLNERYITATAVAQALRGTGVQLQATVMRTPDCGKLNAISADYLKDLIYDMVDEEILRTVELKGTYGRFDILKTGKNMSKYQKLLAWAKTQPIDRSPEKISESRFTMEFWIQKIAKKEAAGKNPEKDLITMLKYMNGYEMLGYYQDQILEIFQKGMTDSIRSYCGLLKSACQLEKNPDRKFDPAKQKIQLLSKIEKVNSPAQA